MPKPTVAIIGASANRSKFGNRSLRAHRDKGYEVFPVNPKGGLIEGLPVYRTIAEVPAARLDRVSMYVPPQIGITLLEAIAAKGCGELWLNPGSESEELIARARELGIEPVVACSLIDVGGS
jgi:predicted CoA-binding protein